METKSNEVTMDAVVEVGWEVKATTVSVIETCRVTRFRGRWSLWYVMVENATVYRRTQVCDMSSLPIILDKKKTYKFSSSKYFVIKC